MKKLPLGSQTFADFKEENYVYVDKTKEIYKMINSGKKFFLSRPRRFGKSLLVSTLEELFKGSKDLFEGFYIYDKWDWNKSYPIIKIDMGKLSFSSSKIFKKSLCNYIKRLAKKYEIKLDNEEDLLTDSFVELIEEIYHKTNQKVVVLIDEYDKPILDNIDDSILAEDIRKILRSFYRVLKHDDEYLSFIFITGISKFSKTSIFSDLNQLTDLTIHPEYSTICGYTQGELEYYFNDYIKNQAIKDKMGRGELLSNIKVWYNGYSWDGVNFLYNPYAISLFFDSGLFKNYWSYTGTPDYFIKYLSRNGLDFNVLFEDKISIGNDFPDFDIENLDLTTVLLQSGYLTIKEHEYVPAKINNYILDIPNKEVHDALFSDILAKFVKKRPKELMVLGQSMKEQILTLDEKGLKTTLKILMELIPFPLDGRIEKNLKEATYHMIYLFALRLIGFDIRGENLNFKGSADGIAKVDDTVIVLEFKYSNTATTEKMLKEAGKQTYDKDYFAPFMDSKVILLQIAFQYKDDVDCKIKQLKIE